MDITHIAYIIAKLAPLLGGVIAGPGGVMLGWWAASVFSSEMSLSDVGRAVIKMMAFLIHINLLWNV